MRATLPLFPLRAHSDESQTSQRITSMVLWHYLVQFAQPIKHNLVVHQPYVAKTWLTRAVTSSRGTSTYVLGAPKPMLRRVWTVFNYLLKADPI